MRHPVPDSGTGLQMVLTYPGHHPAFP